MDRYEKKRNSPKFAALSRAMDGYNGAHIRMSSAVVAMVTERRWSPGCLGRIREERRDGL
eukprot:9319085-Pyramimonas_sp.AAC.1